MHAHPSVRRAARWVAPLLAATLPVAIATPLTVPAEATDAQTPMTEVDAYIREQVARSPLPGLSVAITHEDKVVHLGGYGTAGDGGPMTPDTAVRTASLSKSFTAVAVLQLVDDGAIELDAPVRRYLPGFTPTGGRITVRHLLNHTSGLSDRGFDDLWHLDQNEPGDRVELLTGARIDTEPGTAFAYFNPNYEVLARIVEVVSSQDFDDALSQRVLAPAGMPSTTSVARAEHADATTGLAQGHVIAFGRPVAIDEPAGFVTGSAGVVSTAADLGRWLIVHSNDGTIDGEAIVSPQGLALAHTPPDDIDTTYGMGWWTGTRNDRPAIEHNGVLATSYAEMVLLPDSGHGIVMLANANHAFTDVPRITEGVAALLAGQPVPDALVTHRRLVWVMTLLILVGVAVRTRGLARSRDWALRSTGRPAWRSTLAVARLGVPLAVLVALPTLVSLAAGRVFPHRLLLLAAPELATWLVVASATGLVLAGARITTLRNQ